VRTIFHHVSTEAIARLFRVTGSLPNIPGRYNTAPGQDLPVIRRRPETGERRLDLLRWGLILHWAKDRKIAWRCINARAENIARIAAFREVYAVNVPGGLCREPGIHSWRYPNRS
jgi:putative SOS response-associated peptidase YedK